MLKLLATTVLLSSVVSANQNAKIEQFLSEKFKENPAIVNLKVKVTERMGVPSMPSWNAVIVSVDATLKAKPQDRAVRQKMVWFTDGNVITKELTSLSTGESLKNEINPTFKDAYYKNDNLIYGKKNAKYKVAIFSDPLCPFCSTFVPKAIEEMKKQPEKFAIYYYHFPLAGMHPAAVEITQAAIAAEIKGIKNVALRMYNLKIDPKERDVRKILDVFNRKMGTDIEPSDLRTPEVQAHYKSDLKIAADLLVAGTPTVFLDGKLDRTKRLYEKVK
ncbi:DsbA family protein [Sulfurimonas sp.]|uniref:DsbA family protein n=1 Tax=Sulfurimonas sp. TaxID=2022749 RepID=UPI0039E2194D